MKVLIDMNLSPQWAGFLRAAGFDATHWSQVGDARAKDSEIFEYAREGGWVVFTHDLDFGTLLAHTQAGAPSVVQIRTQELVPETTGALLTRVLRQFEVELAAGALLTLDDRRQRVRMLPLRR